jgi:hypothetical protein
MQTQNDIYCFICPSHCVLTATFDETGKMIKVIADSRSGEARGHHRDQHINA